MGNARIDKQSGFSLLELVIVLVIIAVLSTIAIIVFTGAKTDMERQAVAREFKVYLERARFDSVKRRAALQADQANIVLSGPSAFTAQIDFDADGVMRANELRPVDFTQRSRTHIRVSDTGLAFPITIRFNQRGQVRATDGLGAAIDQVVFTICSSTNCSPTSTDRTILALSPSGTVTVFRNGQTPPGAPPPVIGNVTPVLNCYVLISNSNTTCSL